MLILNTIGRCLALVGAGALALAALVGSGCSSDGAPGVTGESAVDAKNKDLQGNQRQIALENLWEDAGADPAKRTTARETAKEILWKGSAPPKLRERAWALLISDASPDGRADTRNFLRLRLPTETQWSLIVPICASVVEAARGPEGDAWKSVTASLVRSYARKVPVPPDADRPEREALAALHPGKDVEWVVFDVFVRPVENGAPARPDDFVEKSRTAAWELLGRLDPTGAKRTALAAEATNASEPIVRDINRCARELGVVPITASELSWLRGLMDEKDKRAAAWWSQASSAVGRLSPEQKIDLQMRHLEPVRWASENVPEWASASRDQLLGILAQRLEGGGGGGRRMWRKTEGLKMGEETSREALSDHRDRLSWGDALALLVIDRALESPSIRAALMVQADADRADTSCEHGGVIWARGLGGKAADGEAFGVRGYQPRTTQRVNDRTFTAPEEMFADSVWSLVHYHFHAQTETNRDYAGPGRGDMEYASTHGRNCLVFTSVQAGVLNVDFYTRGGSDVGGGGPITIDLGEVRAGR